MTSISRLRIGRPVLLAAASWSVAVGDVAAADCYQSVGDVVPDGLSIGVAACVTVCIVIWVAAHYVAHTIETAASGTTSADLEEIRTIRDNLIGNLRALTIHLTTVSQASRADRDAVVTTLRPIHARDAIHIAPVGSGEPDVEEIGAKLDRWGTS